MSAFAKLETELMWDKSAKWIITTHGVGEGCGERLHCDKLTFGMTYGVELGVCFSERLCLGSGYIDGERVGNTEDFCVMVGIVAEFEGWLCSIGGVESIIECGCGGRGRGYEVVELGMIQCLNVCVDRISMWGVVVVASGCANEGVYVFVG